MRLAGKISGWNDEKGYGFVVPPGGDRAFVHIKAFQNGSRRPVDGDLISYTASRDVRDRIIATQVRFADQQVKEPRSRSTDSQRKPLPRIGIATAFLLISIICTLLGILPTIIPIGYVLLSGVSYLLYLLDKAVAGKNMPRIPENTLHLIDLCGGWPGALIAQQQVRHKTIKTSFQIVFWFTVAANIALVVWLVQSGIAHSLSTSFLGA